MWVWVWWLSGGGGDAEWVVRGSQLGVEEGWGVMGGSKEDDGIVVRKGWDWGGED